MSVFATPDCFATESKEPTIPVIVLQKAGFDDWLEAQDDIVRGRVAQAGFEAKAGASLLITGEDGLLRSVIVGASDPMGIYDLSAVPDALQKAMSRAALEHKVFELRLAEELEAQRAYLSWALGCYQFTYYKPAEKPAPKLLLGKHVQRARLEAYVQGISLLRNMINVAPNDMGPAEIEDAASNLARKHKARIKVARGKALEKGFPLVKAVGQAAAEGRDPRFIEVTWGDKAHPVLCVVGKGVAFDTGGLDLKPSGAMALMKKDMGGAAHALGLAHLIMALELPVRLHVLIPAVENAVGGNAFRPSDVYTSRSGRAVENNDTDAEGRLILADALTYAREQDPDLIIDFATLTGSARAALGQDIPAGFSNDDSLQEQLRVVTAAAQDLIWPMPLYQDYRGLLEDGGVADTTNHVSGVHGDLIYSALFLQGFVGLDEKAPRWVHVDCFAWERAGRPGRRAGGKDTGLRGIFALLEALYRS